MNLDDLVRKVFREELKAGLKPLQDELKLAKDEIKALTGKLANVAKVGAVEAAKTKAKSVAEAPKAAPKAKPGVKWEGSASDFIRSMPDASARDICEAAEAAGLDVKAGLVYQVRANDKKNGAPKRSKATPKTAEVETKSDASAESTTPPPELAEVIAGIEKILKGDIVSVKNIIAGLQKRKLMPDVSEPEKYISYLLEDKKDLFVRAGNGRYRKIKKAELKAQAKATPKPPAESKAESSSDDSGRGGLSSFIRAQMANGVTEIKDIIAAGEKEGLEIKAGLIYSIRAAEKAKGGKSPSPKAERVAEANESESVVASHAEVVAEASSDPQAPDAPVVSSEYVPEPGLFEDEDPSFIDFKLLAEDNPPPPPIDDPFMSV